MSQLYEMLGWSRQAHDQMLKRLKKREHLRSFTLLCIKEMRPKFRHLGSRRLYYQAGITTMGITQFEKLMSGAGLTVKRLRRRIITTESKGHKHIYPNLLMGGFTLHDVNEVVVCDLTYFQNSSGLYYIFLITDVYSQRIVGATCAEDKRSVHALKALRQVVALRGKEAMECTIHHSDKGSEFRSDMYIEEMLELAMQISMARNCIENGYAERRNGTIKNEFLLYSEMAINNICQLRKALKIAVHRYNHIVVQAKLGYRSPAMYEAWIASLPPQNRPVKQLYDFTKNKKVS